MGNRHFVRFFFSRPVVLSMEALSLDSDPTSSLAKNAPAEDTQAVSETLFR
jgi:hypothetical protein